MNAMTLSQIELLGKRSLKSLAAPFSRGWMAARWQRPTENVGQVQILAYHRIVADIAQAERTSIGGLVVSAATFARHLEVVREAYEIVSLDDALAVLRGERRARRPVAVLTIDDGYRDVYEHAWPVLQRMKLPALVYVPTALIGTSRLLDHDRFYWLMQQAQERDLHVRALLEKAGVTPERAALYHTARANGRLADQLNYQPLAARQTLLQQLEALLGLRHHDYPADYALMDWRMMREMAAGCITFGAHTDHHVVLTLESLADAEREIRQSKQVLEAQLQRPARHFSYPNGHYNEAIRQLVERAGFASATTTERMLVQSGDDPFTLGRVSLCEESTRGITGNYSMAVARLRLAA